MPVRIRILVCLVFLVVVGCGEKQKEEAEIAPPPKAAPVVLKDEIPADQLGPVLSANRLGIGYLEQFEYAKATEQFRIVRKLAPGWIPGAINLSIALLNDSGVQAENSKKAGGDENAFANNFEEAVSRLDDVLKRDPKNLHAHYCRGIILQFLMADPNHPENLVRAHNDFQAVVDADPSDAHAWFKLAETLYRPDPDVPGGGRPIGPEGLPKKIEYLSKALEKNPYLVAALHQLHLCYGQKGERETQAKLIAQWQKLNPKTNAAAPGELVTSAYGEVGKYASAIDPFGDALPKVEAPKRDPKFDAPMPLNVMLPAGSRWAKSTDFTGKFAVHGRVRQRFGAVSAVFDADADGKLDLYLTSAIVGPKGLRDTLLLNKGDGTFTDATEQLGMPLDRASLGVAAADFDADKRVDLFLTGVGGNYLLRNAKKGFEDVSAKAGIAPSKYLSLTARWMDLDQDGDLDLYVINHTLATNAEIAFTDAPIPGAPNVAYRNDGKPAAVPNRPADNWAPIATAGETPATEGLSLVFTNWGEASPITGGEANHVGLAMLDIDNDRDLDIVLADEGKPLTVVINDRLGVFHTASLETLGSAKRNGLLAVDLDKDGLVDLVSIETTARVKTYRNTSTRSKPAFVEHGTGAVDWQSAVATDLDLDTWTDLIGLPVPASHKPLAWARNHGDVLLSADLPLAPEGDSATVGFTHADLGGDALPDILTLRDGDAPRLAINRGSGANWVSLALGGRWKTSFDHMRSNAEGLGARIQLEGDGLDARFDHVTTSSGLGQNATPVVIGLGDAKEIQLLHIRWPDGVLQCELNTPGGTSHTIAEYNRKTGSCPVLFTWNGERFVCLGDFLGGGGLGYLVAPGVYGQPDRDESVAIAPDQLKAVDGIYRMSITEPMDEIAYLDHLMLEVVDRPPGVFATPDERFAPEGPRPSGELVVWSKAIQPIKATDHAGRDVTEKLKAWDRNTVDQFSLLRGWIGYAEEHAVALDFGDRLQGFGPNDQLVLCLAGWVEYPYSQTNFAASTAGTALRPPVLERKNEEGKWEVINPSPGYPAGLPRMMTLDLTGKLGGKSCELRLTTNMECYWDQAFIAVRQPLSVVKTTRLPVLAAKLSYRGYTREVSPDGRLPLIYDYNYVDPAPLARLSGMLTRYGDVTKLLQTDDDQLCLVGPGDEARVEFDARRLSKLPEGWTRSYVLKSVGYCKDVDPFTATSDTVGPLPWKGMPEFPFAKPVSRPSDPGYDEYLREYQTRPAATR